MPALGPWLTALGAMVLTSPLVVQPDVSSSSNGTADIQVAREARAALASQRSHVLVALGDSITFGYNLGNNEKPSPLAFPYLFAKKEGWRAIDLGVPGWTSGDLLRALTTDAAMRSDVAAAQVVTVDIGSNDLLLPALAMLPKGADWARVTPTSSQAARLSSELARGVQDVRSNLASILGLLHRYNPRATVIVYDLYNPFPASDPWLHQTAEAAIVAANAAIVADAVSAGDPVADAYDTLTQPAVDILPHDVHPTALGQRLLAEAGEQALAMAPMFQAAATPQGQNAILQWLGDQLAAGTW
ncbi:SGNH/GDSL hydrolase family protein [Alicyclobacillus acidocaldarius]|uniref:Lipolytic protein G-D-S-L family n=1 Tax=Alicyclobacillus acidocaldarius (strain Tc-4-1) TaxID=1048834 RepID=F8IFD2_ALIAT|nr:SGNH/GDSL hydrolase family protein [Alicyclobacillus acidocaldarius]AEJ42834.1 lipolytic protein G-D-S-L family [Alicyclobacillus acidocaldarius subsp. acidocaldarius Tc-4-1]